MVQLALEDNPSRIRRRIELLRPTGSGLLPIPSRGSGSFGCGRKLGTPFPGHTFCPDLLYRNGRWLATGPAGICVYFLQGKSSSIPYFIIWASHFLTLCFF